MAETKHELDLPLHSNIDDIRVRHYNLELTCDMQKKIFHGSVVIVLAPLDAACVPETDRPVIESSQVNEIQELDVSPVIESSQVNEIQEIDVSWQKEAVIGQALNASVNSQLDTKREDYQGGTEIVKIQSSFRTVDKQSMGMGDIKGQTEIVGTPSSIQMLDAFQDGTEKINDSNSCKLLLDTKAKYINQEDVKTTVTDCGHVKKTGKNPEDTEMVQKNHLVITTREGQEEDVEEETVIYNMSETESENINSDTQTNTELLDLVSSFKDEAGKRTGFIETVNKIVELSDHKYTSMCLENNTMSETTSSPDFVMIIDSWDLNVTSVNEIGIQDTCCDVDKLCEEDKTKLKELFDECDENALMFFSEKTCLKFWKPGIKHARHFPRCIRISYQTKPCGSSLKWTSDQDGRPCVFTHGHWINNRSLFPSQDVPGALATWQAYIHVPSHMTTLMTGDQNPEIRYTSDNTNLKTYIYHTDMVVPSSTLALAVGCWTEVEIIPCLGQRSSSSSKQLPCRLFTPKTHQYQASTLLGSYIPKCMDAAFSLLGSHPFKRLDILIVPASFASLGMASPNLMFLSQSVLSDDGHMLIRVAHEMSHSWFGLAIGPSDWHEEWLSEGFCTYTESVIHATANQMRNEEFTEEREIYDHIKRCVLEAEIVSTSTDLQTLRNIDSNNDSVKGDKDCLKGVGDSVKDQSNGVKYVSNGMNPDKGFLQIHYVKGYFLLRFLEGLVGYITFCDFLKKLVKTFHHMLIDSMDVLRLFFKTFPDIRSTELSEETILNDWLNFPGLPKISGKAGFENNKLVEEVSALELKVCECNSIWTNLHWRKRRKIDLASYLTVPKVKQVQLLLFLDRLLDMKRIQPKVLYYLNEQLGLSWSNADVRHKWCELVVKNRLIDSYDDIRHFLEHHQAMGVYLFGELIISQDGKQRKLAEECFTAICSDMEEGVKQVVQAMIYVS